jgi:SAM-dependent methyltransferase
MAREYLSRAMTAAVAAVAAAPWLPYTGRIYLTRERLNDRTTPAANRAVDTMMGATGASAVSLWRCLACGDVLRLLSAESVLCEACGAKYPAVGTIPDLRARGGSTFDADGELEDARRFYFDTQGGSLEAVMQKLCDRPENDDAARAFRVRQILESPRKLRGQITGWLRPCLAQDKLLLDIGCGSGALLAELAAQGYRVAGIDASMTMLVAAQRMIEAHGGTAQLACTFAEALPIAGSSIGAITMYDSIEHVASVPLTIGEACRVLESGGHLAISTPNRFSLAAEPHVFIWGVGWLPRPWQVPYVRWRNGQDYRGTQLLSPAEMARLLRRHPDLAFDIRAPQVPEVEIENFSRRRAALARLYNGIAKLRGSQWALLAVGPFFQVMARKSHGGT